MWSPWPSGTTGKTTGSDASRIAAMWSPTSAIDHDGRYTPGVSETTALATRPASATSISPVTEQDSCASQPTTGATNSGPIGGEGGGAVPPAPLLPPAGPRTVLFSPRRAPSVPGARGRPTPPALGAGRVGPPLVA